MFKGLALEVAIYMRAKKKGKALELEHRRKLLDFYDGMISKGEFGNVTKASFHEVFEHQRNQKRKKNSAETIAEVHARFEIDSPPPSPSAFLLPE